MGPFIPQGWVNPELTLFFALVLGLGFGYVLEQAGFSSSRKLAGLFYGYDFVVLRVFFTAGITAMTGLVFFSYLGWVDMSMVYVNPTFLWSALAGGVIMGFGFIMGGFCPGTSLVGAVIGKVDAMVFIAGIFIGIFVFGHFYDVFEPLYNGSFLGHIFIYDSLGISKAWFAFMLAAVALMAFAITQLIEDRVNKTEPALISARPSYRTPAFLIMGLLTLYLFLPQEKASTLKERPARMLLAEWEEGSAFVGADKVVYDIMHGNDQVVLIDVRSQEQYTQFTLPGAIHIPLSDVLSRKYAAFFKKDPRQKVFFSDGTTLSTQAWTLTRRAGFEKVHMLEGGLNGLFDMVFSDKPSSSENGYINQFSNRFAIEAREFFQGGGHEKAGSPKQDPVHKIIEVVVPAASGGC